MNSKLALVNIQETDTDADLVNSLLTGLLDQPLLDRTELCRISLQRLRDKNAKPHQDLPVALILHEFLLNSVTRARALYNEFELLGKVEGQLWQCLGGMLNLQKLRLKNLDWSGIDNCKIKSVMMMVAGLFMRRSELEHAIKYMKKRDFSDLSLLHFLLALAEFSKQNHGNYIQHICLANELASEGSLLNLFTSSLESKQDHALLQQVFKDVSMISLFTRLRKAKGLTVTEKEDLTVQLNRSDVAMWELLRRDYMDLVLDVLQEKNCTDAIELVIKYYLVPEQAPVMVDHWPWMVRIYSLGRFGVYNIKGEDLSVRASCKKPFELLKVLIAQGGRNVSSSVLMDLLWPEAEGDVASRSFSTTLHRLRKIIGKDALVLKNGMLTLDERYCWVDTWYLSRTIDQFNDKLRQSGVRNLTNLITNISVVYRGAFLSNTLDHWAVPFRNRIKNKVLHSLYLAKDRLGSDHAIAALDYSIANVSRT